MCVYIQIQESYVYIYILAPGGLQHDALSGTCMFVRKSYRERERKRETERDREMEREEDRERGRE